MSKCPLLWMALILSGTLAAAVHGSPPAQAADDYASWPLLKSTFPSTSGGGMMIKGYDPVITGLKCVTTFMAVPPGDNPPVYPAYIEFEAVAKDGGTLCTNGEWRTFSGDSGTTPFQLYFKDGVFRGQ